MGSRLRRIAPLALAAAVLGVPPASAEEFSSCWVTHESDDWSGQAQPITRCRIAGGEVVDYASDNAVPSVLYANVGTDLTGACWFYTSTPTDYLILALYANGDADMAIADPAAPGGVIVLGDILPRCTSEPAPAVDPAVAVWEYVSRYIHDPPTPGLNPEPGRGVTGLDTFVGVTVPGDHATQLTSGVTILDVEIEVAAVVVDWGDDTSSTYPADPGILAGYPDGSATHVYESKRDRANLSVSYDWTARWRVTGGSWISLPVPNTTSTVAYPVAEIVSALHP